ncbi:hypothetical protein NHX12_004726 [Muraenolepis orangiensis]|uniref:Cadherin domain-containing protein n=1 Tax=Muraenolepis orangiensis TaxID=630683 RepID=A0A9Q0ICI8_9TELE|nr:hypothetical protein NHX12_004726 [Muraenolepis orangiensis]
MWSFSVSELAIPGAEVGRISASDTDVGENARLEYTILEGETGDTFNITRGNQEAVIVLNKQQFSVDRPVSGKNSIHWLESGISFLYSTHQGSFATYVPRGILLFQAAVDYESRSSYSFSVEVMNPIVDPRFLRHGPFKDRASVRVAVLDADEPPRFSRTSYLMDVSENCPPACTAGRITPVVQVLRAVDRDEGGNDSAVFFSIPPESSAALNFTVRDSGGLTSSGTVTVSVCPCLKGEARAEERGKGGPRGAGTTATGQSYLPSPGLSTAALLAILACVATLLAVTGLSLSLRRQKRDSLTPLEEDDVRENIITYDDEGGGEADTAAFDIAALQSAPHNSRTRVYRTLDSRNVRYSQHSQDKASTYSWAQDPGVDPNYPGPGGGALYGRLCYSSHTLPVLRRGPAAGGQLEAGAAKPGYRIPGGGGILHPDHSLVIQNQAVVGAMESGAVYVSATELSASRVSRVSMSDGGTPPRTADGRERGEAGGGSSTAESSSGEDKMNGLVQDGDWVQSQTLPRDHNLVLTRSGSVMGQGAHGPGGWACDLATLPLAGRRSSRGPQSPKQGCPGQTGESESGCGGANGNGKSGGGTPMENHHHHRHHHQQQLQQQQWGGGCGYPAGPQGEAAGQRDYAATLGRGGLEVGRLDRDSPEGAGLLLSGAPPPAYPEGAGFLGDWRDRAGLGGYVLARRDMSPQMLPIPGQARGLYGGGSVMGFGGSWVPGMEPGVRGMAPGSDGGEPSLALRVGEFLRLRLAQVTFDPTQPPYDSVQVYGLEGSGSRAGSLSSLESEAGDKDDWVSGLEDWGPQFHSLAQLFKEKEEEQRDKREDREEEEEEEEEERSTRCMRRRRRCRGRGREAWRVAAVAASTTTTRSRRKTSGGERRNTTVRRRREKEAPRRGRR